MLSVSLAIGLVGGVLVLMTLGLAAAFVGHAITRFALFLTMGHTDPATTDQTSTGGGATADSGAYIIPARTWPRGGDGDDGRGGFGPVRRA